MPGYLSWAAVAYACRRQNSAGHRIICGVAESVVCKALYGRGSGDVATALLRTYYERDRSSRRARCCV